MEEISMEIADRFPAEKRHLSEKNSCPVFFKVGY